MDPGPARILSMLRSSLRRLPLPSLTLISVLILGACVPWGTIESKAAGRSEAAARPGTQISSQHLDPGRVEVIPTQDPTVGVVENIDAFIEAESASCQIDDPVPLPVEPGCIDLTVPENWADPESGATVTLHVAVFRADGGEDDAIIYLDGGPGGHTLANLAFSFSSLVEPFLTDRDFIVYDQRGVGTSDPELGCPELTRTTIADMTGAIASEDVLDATLEAQASCATRLQSEGVDLTAYNSIASANDLEAIRIALGYTQLNPIGISYGTRLGQTYLRMYPESVRTLTLDSVFPTAANLWSDFDPGVERSFRQLFDGCAASPECSDTYPNFEDDYFRLLDQLDTDPATVTFTNYRTGSSTDSRLTGDDVLAFTFQALYSQSAFALLPQMTVDALEGDYRVLEALGSSVVTSLGFFSVGMQLSVECNEEIPFEAGSTRAPIESNDPRFQRIEQLSETGDFFELCPSWPSGQAPPVENETVVSDVPTLLLAGQYDPITPPSGMDAVASGLTTSYQYVFPHEGHGIVPTVCGARITAQFIADPTSEPETSCIEVSPEPEWIPRATTDVTLVEFETDGLTGVRGLRPEGWTDTGFGSFARLANAVDQTAVIFQPTQGLDAGFMAETFGRQIDIEMTERDPLTIDGEPWRRFQGSSSIGALEVIVSAGTDGVIAALIAQPEELDTLRDLVLIPGARAAEPS